MRAERSRPAGDRAASEQRRGPKLSASVDRTAFTDRTQHPAFRQGFLSGAIVGWLDGYAAAESELAAAWRPVAERIRRLGSPQSATWAEIRRRREERGTVGPVPTYAECMASWGDAA